MIISVASGKGGTGKTLVATSLALSLKEKYSIQLLDCDVEEPNDHVFLKPVFTHKEAASVQVPEVDEDMCTYCRRCAEVCTYNAIAVVKQTVLVFPGLCHGCGACSYLCPVDAISMRDCMAGHWFISNSKYGPLVHARLGIAQDNSGKLVALVRKRALEIAVKEGFDYIISDELGA